MKAGKAMFLFKTVIKKELVEHIRDAEMTLNAVWETMAKLFSK